MSTSCLEIVWLTFVQIQILPLVDLADRLHRDNAVVEMNRVHYNSVRWHCEKLLEQDI
jgi:hypothetical protein